MAEPQIDHDFDERPADAVEAPDLTEAAIEDYGRRAQTLGRNPRSTYGALDRQGDDSLIVEFFTDTISGEEYVRMQAPGDRLKVYEAPANDHDRQRFPQQYEAFRRRESQYAGQTMLSDMPWINNATRFHLASFKVVTVEQLSMLPESSVEKMGLGVRKLRERAQKHLRVDSNVHEQMHSLQSAVAERDAKLAESSAMMAEMAERLRKLEEAAGTDKTAPARRAKASR